MRRETREKGKEFFFQTCVQLEKPEMCVDIHEEMTERDLGPHSKSRHTFAHNFHALFFTRLLHATAIRLKGRSKSHIERIL